MKSTFILMAALVLGACAGPRETLVVKQYQLRDEQKDVGGEPMVRMEKARHLRGAVSMEERRQRLGQYYSLVWSDPKGVGQGPVELVFQYQQGATGSRVKRMSREFPASDGKGVAEFAVIGDDYFDGGRVLAWRASVWRSGTELASRQSYLWR